ncbi:MAG: hypothetical protein K2Z80_18025 [Xanthobacteraceae bacterium]|nr:hypothetical protein [Xanthobacteraceae bacterium]
MAKPTCEFLEESGLGQIETTFDPFDAAIDAVEAVGEIGVLAFENAEARLHLAHIVAKAIDGASDVPQMLETDIVGLDHAHLHSILVIS